MSYQSKVNKSDLWRLAVAPESTRAQTIAALKAHFAVFGVDDIRLTDPTARWLSDEYLTAQDALALRDLKNPATEHVEYAAQRGDWAYIHAGAWTEPPVDYPSMRPHGPAWTRRNYVILGHAAVLKAPDNRRAVIIACAINSPLTASGPLGRVIARDGCLTHAPSGRVYASAPPNAPHLAARVAQLLTQPWTYHYERI